MEPLKPLTLDDLERAQIGTLKDLTRENPLKTPRARMEVSAGWGKGKGLFKTPPPRDVRVPPEGISSFEGSFIYRSSAKLFTLSMAYQYGEGEYFWSLILALGKHNRTENIEPAWLSGWVADAHMMLLRTTGLISGPSGFDKIEAKSQPHPKAWVFYIRVPDEARNW